MKNQASVARSSPFARTDFIRAIEAHSHEGIFCYFPFRSCITSSAETIQDSPFPYGRTCVLVEMWTVGALAFQTSPTTSLVNFANEHPKNLLGLEQVNPVQPLTLS